MKLATYLMVLIGLAALPTLSVSCGITLPYIEATEEPILPGDDQEQDEHEERDLSDPYNNDNIVYV